MQTYLEQRKRCLSNPVQQKICETVYVSLISGLSLSEYIEARAMHCQQSHAFQCLRCQNFLKVARMVLEHGYCTLSNAFGIITTDVVYTAEHACRLLLQMPLVAIRIGNPEQGCSFSILMEKFSGTDYSKIGAIINGLANTSMRKGVNLEKSIVKMLLSISQSDRERECLRYAVYKASGMTATMIRRTYGFENMQAHAASVESALLEIKQIREAIDDLAKTKEESLLIQLGFDVQVDSADSSINDSSENEEDSFVQSLETSAVVGCDLTHSHNDDKDEQNPLNLQVLLKESHYNWFKFLEQCLQKNPSADVEKLYNEISRFELNTQELRLIEQSYQAFLAAETDMYDQDHIARSVNGEVVSESESDDPESYVGLSDPFSKAGKNLVVKWRAQIKRRARRQKAKAVAERRFLCRKISKQNSRLLKECPDIGKTIENYVQDRNVGADAWRRTGVLTFDGNVKLKQKATYEGIRLHLQEIYNRNFSYGTVVQLCIPRNKRRMSATRYQGLAQVTSRRCRKGFTLKFNPDSHWSGAFYKGLHKLEYVDGRDLLNINRDDATGFWLDTLTTCKQYKTPVVQGKDALTTRTDFVNRYPSVLQTTSYNFTATRTTAEICVGIVKAPKLHEKSPAQHAADLELLESIEELHPLFCNLSNGLPKSIECIRVDGASDEGPGHEEVQFYWTARHLSKGKIVTLVTSRSSGSSYLNRVELQNGCLSLGHANTFIPSTLKGSCVNPETGVVDNNKLKENLEVAIDAYISRVNGTPCGNTTIQLYKGAKDSEHVKSRDNLLTFLKGSKKAKLILEQQEPEQYLYFKTVWDVRCRHMVSGLPQQYVFMLTCCYQPHCCHTECKSGKPTSSQRWYSEGPPITMLPLPVIDQERPWGGNKCNDCKGACTGHYKTVFTNVFDTHATSSTAPPPSTILKEEFRKAKHPISEKFLQEAAKKALLSIEDTKIWLEHLQTVLDNGRRGAKKAAATRRARKVGTVSEALNCEESSECYCGLCGKQYVEETVVPEIWIACDMCDMWYCGTCEHLTAIPEKDTYICSKCSV